MIIITRSLDKTIGNRKPTMSKKVQAIPVHNKTLVPDSHNNKEGGMENLKSINQGKISRIIKTTQEKDINSKVLLTTINLPQGRHPRS